MFEITLTPTEERRIIAGQEKKLGFIGSMVLRKGMKVFAVELETLQAKEAIYKIDLQTGRRQIHRHKGVVYVSAINAKNAVKKVEKAIRKIKPVYE